MALDLRDVMRHVIDNADLRVGIAHAQNTTECSPHRGGDGLAEPGFDLLPEVLGRLAVDRDEVVDVADPVRADESRLPGGQVELGQLPPTR